MSGTVPRAWTQDEFLSQGSFLSLKEANAHKGKGNYSKVPVIKMAGHHKKKKVPLLLSL